MWKGGCFCEETATLAGLEPGASQSSDAGMERGFPAQRVFAVSQTAWEQ